MTTKTDRPSRPVAGGLEEGRRNSFLDAVRTIALLRVIVWHTYGYAWISYLVASMPAMIFVAGSLMAYSLRRGHALDVLLRRFRRLLIPLWVLAAAAIAVMMVYEQEAPSLASHFNERAIAWWVFPIWDPRGSNWGLTWWAPLWYLRCITWLLLASPLLLWLWRRAGPAILLVPLAGIAISEERLRADAALPWQLQDFALYSVFWMLGFAYIEGRFTRIGKPVRGGLCAVFAAAAAAWALTQDVPGSVVNASYPLHLLVGLAWLFGALTFEDAVGKFAIGARVARVVYWVNERALTIYLWHVAGLFAMYQVLWAEDHSRLWRDVFALPIVVSVTFLAVLLIGWVEDVAAGRRPRLWPRRAGPSNPRRLVVAVSSRLLVTATVASGLAALVLAVGSIVENPSGVVQAGARTVPASGVGLHLRTEQAQVMAARPTQTVLDKPDPVTPEELQSELEAWRGQWGLLGATVSLRRASGEAWTGATGVHEDGSPFVPDERYEVASITKTFTAALVLRLVERELIDLDAPASTFVPDFPTAERFSVRNLIQHTSGLITADVMPYEALAQAAEAGLQFEPGTSFLYSRAGYYMLALIIEQVLGTSYTKALHEELLDPLGLTSTMMDEEIKPLPYHTHPYHPALPGYEAAIWTAGGLHGEIAPEEDHYRGTMWSSGGLWSTTSDLARWAVALWGSNQVVSAATLDAMTTFLEREFDFTGLGTYPLCPCWREGDRLRAERWGHGGQTLLEYDPADQIAVAMDIHPTFQDENVVKAIDDLSERLLRLVRGRPMPMMEPAAEQSASTSAESSFAYEHS